MTVEGIIFDADGTLLDTRELIFQAYEHTLAAHGHIVPSRAEIALQMGKPLRDCYLVFTDNGDIELLAVTHREFQLKRPELTAEYAGMRTLLAAIKAKDIKIGICTSRGKQVPELLRQIGILSYCDAVITGVDVEQHKPHPEGLFKALEIMDVAPEGAVMVGDTSADIGAGKAANVAFTIGVTHGFGTREILEESGADFIVDSLMEILPLIP